MKQDGLDPEQTDAEVSLDNYEWFFEAVNPGASVENPSATLLDFRARARKAIDQWSTDDRVLRNDIAGLVTPECSDSELIQIKQSADRALDLTVAAAQELFSAFRDFRAKGGVVENEPAAVLAILGIKFGVTPKISMYNAIRTLADRLLNEHGIVRLHDNEVFGGVEAPILVEIRSRNKGFYGMVVAQANSIEMIGDVLVFTFAPAHHSLRSQVESKLPWIESIAEETTGRKIAVVSKIADDERVDVLIEESQIPARSVDEHSQSLTSLVGLESVKADVADLISLLEIQEMRRKRGLPVAPTSLHSVFVGNPGTGKTTVARILADVYKSIGLLKTGQLVETDRSGLVAGYVGHTALKVQEVVQSALGGVLFIDEAYSLSSSASSWDFGAEAVETLLKLMEDHRNNLVVIVAGYTDRMNDFLTSNPGLRSRFRRFFHFDDLTPTQLRRVFHDLAREHGYRVTRGSAEKLESLFQVAHEGRNRSFGNGRFVRNVFEDVVRNQARRLSGKSFVSDSELVVIRASDIPDEPKAGMMGS